MTRWRRPHRRTAAASGPAGRRLGIGVVRGRSMEPSYVEGDRLLLLHRARPKVGKPAVVRLPDGVVAVKRVTERHGDGWWVERDNPAVGVDSWLVGSIPDEDVLARVLLRLWPPRLTHVPFLGTPKARKPRS